MTSIPFLIRPALPSDEPTLWQMLFYAAHMHDEADKAIADAQADPFLSKYVRDWGQAGDIGYVAVDGASQASMGAVWIRHFVAEAEFPELAIAVLPEYIGRGVGTALMEALIAGATENYPAIVLSVRADNSALRLYQRLGFVVTQEIVNRVGTRSYEMILKLKP